MKKRLQAIEEKATRFFTTSEILQMIRDIFRIANATVSCATSLANFKAALIATFSEELNLDPDELREVLR